MHFFFYAFLDTRRMIFLCDMKADKLFACLNHYKKNNNISTIILNSDVVPLRWERV